MISTYCCLAVVLSHIPGNHSLLEAARVELEVAVNCAKEYDKTWHSIIWIQLPFNPELLESAVDQDSWIKY
ncbi:hypothetical protein WKK05_12300 [Nostoc sp. UHCC 0302]|uniref:hypothetical protein n=1 Tax=Nostoc sp. UHCC 0302 TaxID=3134896 RepID=UPI00311CB403